MSGAILLLASALIGGILSYTAKVDPAAQAAAWQSLDKGRIRAAYADNPSTALLAVIDYFRSAGCALFGFGACVHLARRVAPNRLLSRTGYAFALLVPAAALCQCYATTAFLIALSSDFHVPVALLRTIPLFAQTNIVIWVAFLWLAALGVYVWLKRQKRTVKKNKVP